MHGCVVLGSLCGVERCNHEATVGILEHVDFENWWINSDSFDRGNLERHWEQLGSFLRYGLSTIVAESIAGNKEAQGCVGVGVDLSHVEGCNVLVEPWWEQLVAVVGSKCVFVRANLKVKKL